MKLIRPSADHLPSYVAALERGWSPNNERLRAAALEELDAIAADPVAFLVRMDDMDGLGPPVPLPDGSTVPRLPGFRRWMWDGEVVGSIGFRWQPGTTALPAHCLGHIGYSVVPWQQRRGHATAALRQMLDAVRPLGLPYVEVTTDLDNIASQRVILAAGGKLHAHFRKPAQFGQVPALRYRVPLD